ncbi:hypothetical protein [Cesiribacter andamanensis]|nr:hypothetical protein [Cesiribacter andamanensis]
MLLLLACRQEGDGGTNGATTSPYTGSESLAALGYRIDQPAKTYTLPGSLRELSGMQSLGQQQLACIQDEEGIIYLFDLQKGEVVQEVPWGEPGDYEGVAGSREELWVLKSDGTLYQLRKLWTGEAPQVREFQTPLTQACDAEGLSLLPNAQALLIACKEGAAGERRIWRFSTDSLQLDPVPYLQLEHAEMEEEFIETELDRVSLSLQKFLSVRGESGVFVPSGLAIHPLTGDLFILSAASKILVVVDKTGKLSYIQELPSAIFLQPESITFLPDGTLLIGNEGGAAESTILLFTYDAH